MNMKRYIAGIHYAKTLSPEENLLKLLLIFFSFFYGFAIKIRNWLYDLSIIKSKKLGAFIISIGNLTTGGTGKTPITAEIASYISGYKGKKTAILSRGYGGKLSVERVNIISDGKNIFYSAHMAGDEPYWIALNTNNTPVITGKNRFESGQRSINEFGTEVLILDDGFQHRKLGRDLNLLVIDSHNKFGNDLILPAGPLREHIDEIKRADKVIVVNKQSFDETSRISCVNYANELEKRYSKPVFVCQFENTGIFNVKTREELSSNSIVYSFAGIGQPEFFFQYLKEQNFNIVKTREFNDHHLYTKDDIQNIIKEAQRLGATSIVTTEKDAVKLKALLDEDGSEIPLFALKLGLSLDVEKLLEEVK